MCAVFSRIKRAFKAAVRKIGKWARAVFAAVWPRYGSQPPPYSPYPSSPCSSDSSVDPKLTEGPEIDTAAHDGPQPPPYSPSPYFDAGKEAKEGVAQGLLSDPTGREVEEYLKCFQAADSEARSRNQSDKVQDKIKDGLIKEFTKYSADKRVAIYDALEVRNTDACEWVDPSGFSTWWRGAMFANLPPDARTYERYDKLVAKVQALRDYEPDLEDWGRCRDVPDWSKRSLYRMSILSRALQGLGVAYNAIPASRRDNENTVRGAAYMKQVQEFRCDVKTMVDTNSNTYNQNAVRDDSGDWVLLDELSARPPSISLKDASIKMPGNPMYQGAQARSGR